MLRTKRSRLIAAPVAAGVLALTFAGYHAGAAESSGGSDKAGKSQGAAKAEPCLTDNNQIVGDFDGDGSPDRVTNVENTGAAVTIEWGKEGGSFGEKVKLNDLVGVKKGEEATAAVADFDKDNVLDLVVNIVEPAQGDDPNSARVAEYRPGPVERTKLESAETRKLDIGDSAEVQKMGIHDFTDDVGETHPDLVMLNNAGDGVLERSVRLTTDENGPQGFNREADEKYGDWGTPAEPPSFPTDGYLQFYKFCSPS